MSTLNDIASCMSVLGCEKGGQAQEAMRFIRNMTCSISVSEVAQNEELLKLVIGMLKNPEVDEVCRYEAAWAITNVCAGSSEDADRLVSLGAIDALSGALLETLESKDDYSKLQGQCMWALANLISEGNTIRLQIDEYGVMAKLHEVYGRGSMSETLKKDYAFLLSNYCGCKPIPLAAHMRQEMEDVSDMLKTSTDLRVITECLQATSKVSDDNSNHRIQLVVDNNVLSKIVKLTQNAARLRAEDPEWKEVLPRGLRTVGNVLTGTDTQTQVAMDSGCLELYSDLLHNEELNEYWKESLWSISNIAAGTRAQIKQLLSSGILSRVLEIFTATPISVDETAHVYRRETMWVLSNVTSGANAELCKEFMEGYSVVECFLQFMKEPIPSEQIVSIVYEAFGNLMRLQPDLLKQQIEDSEEGLEILLQHHDDVSSPYYGRLNLVERLNLRHSLEDLVPLKILILRKMMWERSANEPHNQSRRGSATQALLMLYEMDEHLAEVRKEGRERGASGPLPSLLG